MSCDPIETVRLCGIDDLTESVPCRIDVGGHRLCVVRIGDTVSAIDDTCSHADVSLSEGEVDPEEATIECWKHGSLFSLTTGEPLTLPATRPVAVYTVSVRDDEVRVALPARSER